MNFVSFNVNDRKAPKGLTCPDIKSRIDHRPTKESCPLCDSPRTLRIIQEKQAEGQESSAKSVETSAWNPTPKLVDRTADGITVTDESASGWLMGCKDGPMHNRSQTSVGRARERAIKMVELRGHGRRASYSSNSSADDPSSTSFDKRADIAPYWDPLAG